MPVEGSRALLDGVPVTELAVRLRIPLLLSYQVVPSTMDAAHEAAAGGSPAGTLVVADEQTAGRGRLGRQWVSGSCDGLWMTLVERPEDPEALHVLSLRVGLALADALEPLSRDAVRLKWPNDLFTSTGKLGGILVEARWRDARVDWVAIGVGLNLRHPSGLPGAALGAVPRAELLDRVVPAVRAAAGRKGPLQEAELHAYRVRDLTAGRIVTHPGPGMVVGIDATGALLVQGDAGVIAHRSGSLVFREDA